MLSIAVDKKALMLLGDSNLSGDIVDQILKVVGALSKEKQLRETERLILVARTDKETANRMGCAGTRKLLLGHRDIDPLEWADHNPLEWTDRKIREAMPNPAQQYPETPEETKRREVQHTIGAVGHIPDDPVHVRLEVEALYTIEGAR